jgi:putative transposase
MDAHGMSERRACKAIGCCRMTIRYQTTRADDAALRQRMRAIAQERRRFGYRRLRVLLKREGYLINHKKLFRLYREERLAVRRRGGRKRAIGTRAPMTVPMAPNERWSLDFVSDQLTDGRRFRILTVVDDCTRECLALVADTSLSGTRVAARMEDPVRVRLHLPSAPGSGAALCRRLRASSRRSHRPTRQIQQPERTQDWIKLGGKVTSTNFTSPATRLVFLRWVFT